MKKYVISLILIFISVASYCDVIFYPSYHHDQLCYSTELIYSFEKAKNPIWTTVFWGGAGCVGSLKSFNQPSYGLEIAIEKRLYFQKDNYKHFFVSAYLGSAYMTDFKDASNIGIIPGFKINYKAEISSKLLLEPYISLSLPLTYDIKESLGIKPVSVVTIGVRFGLFKLKNEKKLLRD
jgi:hypothetical protein